MNTGHYDITLVGFPGGTPTGEPPVVAMQRIFHIDRTTASRFIASMPVTVKHNAPVQLAKQYRDGLQSIGARVMLRPATPIPRPALPPPPHPRPSESCAERCPSPSPPPPSPSPRRSSRRFDDEIPILDGVGVTPTPTPTPCRRPSSRPPPSKPSPQKDVETGFFESILGSLLVPLRGRGLSWFLAALGVAVVMVIGGLVPLVGWLVQLLMSLGLLALCARFFQSCLASTASDDDSPGSLPELSYFFADFILPGIALVLWFVTVNIPVFLWLHTNWGSADPITLIFSPITLLLVAIPYLFYPMGLAQSAVSGSFFSMWNFPKIVVGIVRAPLRYGLVLLVGFLTMLIPTAMVSILGQGPTGVFIMLFVAVAQVVVMAYSHAVMGALMGHLARTKPEAVGQ